MDPIQWNEPKDYKRIRFYQSERANPWAAIQTAAITFAVLIALRLFVEFGPRREGQNPPGWPLTLVMAIPISLFVAYGLPFLLSFISISRVILSEKGINNNIIGNGGVIYFWPWDSISLLELKPVVLGQQEFLTLSLLDENGNKLAELCLSEPKQVEGIMGWAEAKGIQLDQREK